MRLREFRITRYGPVSGVEIKGLGSFNLFCGRNEEGKTLVLEALVKLLCGKTPKGFGCFDRVEELPAGSVVLENSGELMEFPGEGSMASRLGVSGDDFRNIFVIRNSDLSIVDEGGFYTGVADRLTGLKTERIKSIKKSLLQIGKLTSGTKAFRNLQNERLGDRITKAVELLEESGAFMSELEGKDFDGLMKKKFEASENLRAVEKEIDLINQAREREKYEKGRDALAGVESCAGQIAGYGAFTEEGLRKWRDCARDLEKLEAEKAAAEEKLSVLKDKKESLVSKMMAVESEYTISEEKRKVIEEKIKPDLKKYDESAGNILRQRAGAKLFGNLFVLASVLSVISAAGLLLFPGGAVLAAFILSVSMALSFAFLKFRTISGDARLLVLFEDIKNSFAGVGLAASSREDASAALEKFACGHNILGGELSSLKTEIELASREAAGIRDEVMPAIAKGLSEAREAIRIISEESKSGDADEYAGGLEKKGELQKKLERNAAVLENSFGNAEGGISEKIGFWEEALANYSRYRDSAEGIVFNREKLDGLSERKALLEGIFSDTEDELKELEAGLSRLWREARGVFAGESGDLLEDIPCTALADVREIRRRLSEFLRMYDTLKNDSIAAMEIFDEIDESERDKISDLFGEGSAASGYFSNITRGEYHEVSFDRASGGVFVKPRAGGEISPEKLSGGAYDQLYLSIRLALGESLLGDGRGFFIMDDPFIKADSERLALQLDMLRRIAAEGWQVLYFSAKDEVTEFLKDEIDSGDVKSFHAEGFRQR